MPHYNVMGTAKAALESSMRYLAADLGPRNIRVNAISAGAVKTASARAVKDLTSLMEFAKEWAPMKRPNRSWRSGRCGSTVSRQAI